MTKSNLFGRQRPRRMRRFADLLERPPFRRVIARVNRIGVAGGVRSLLADFRLQLRERTHPISIPPASELAARVAGRFLGENHSPLRPVTNATGVLLHTGLGPAPLADIVIERIAVVARDYANVELDLPSGNRQNREVTVSGLVRQFTGTEAAAAVNNYPAAIVLALAALAQGGEVIVSRGELLELDDDVRLPELIRAAGARLREVGTTNKTRPGDYRDAIGADTSAILRVHRSNCRLIGSTVTPALRELVDLARTHSVPLIECIASEIWIDAARMARPGGSAAAFQIQQGADLVLLPGDGFLGGLECGIIAGTEVLVRRLTSHPLARALQVDKLTLAALAATLELLQDKPTAARQIPLLQLLGTPLENLRQRAERIAAQVAWSTISAAEAQQSEAYITNGCLPDERLVSWGVALTPRSISAAQLATHLRQGSPAVVGRVYPKQVFLDLRAVFPRQDADIVAAIAHLK